MSAVAMDHAEQFALLALCPVPSCDGGLADDEGGPCRSCRDVWGKYLAPAGTCHHSKMVPACGHSWWWQIRGTCAKCGASSSDVRPNTCEHTRGEA